MPPITTKQHSYGRITLYWLLPIVLVMAIAFGFYTYKEETRNALSKLASVILFKNENSSKSTEITVNAKPSEIVSGKSTLISWTSDDSLPDGDYYISYSCLPSVYLRMQTARADRFLSCDSPFLVDSSTNLLVAISSESSRNIIVPIKISYISRDENAPVDEGVIEITVMPKKETSDNTEIPVPSSTENNGDASTINPPTNIPNAVITPTTTNPLIPGTKTEKTILMGTSTPTVSNYGKTDLSPKILEIGIIDKVTNAWTAMSTTTVKASDRIALRFEVENIGTKISGQWSFNAVLPTFPMHIFQSDTFLELKPGEKIEFTIGFDNAIPNQDGTIVINVDPNNMVSEASENNNIARIVIHPVSN